MVAISDAQFIAPRDVYKPTDHDDGKNTPPFNAYDLLKDAKSVAPDHSKTADVPNLQIVDQGAKPAEASKDANAKKDEKKPEEHHKDSVRTQLKHFGEGLATGVALEPINGFTQFINHAFGSHIHEIHFKDQEEVDKSTAGKIGKAAGKAVDYLAIAAATGGTGEAIGLSGAAATAVDGAAAGAIKEGFLTPSDDNSKHFLSDRLTKAAEGAVTSATLDGLPAAMKGAKAAAPEKAAVEKVAAGAAKA